jgi:hypothetical protein
VVSGVNLDRIANLAELHVVRPFYAPSKINFHHVSDEESASRPELGESEPRRENLLTEASLIPGTRTRGSDQSSEKENTTDNGTLSAVFAGLGEAGEKESTEEAGFSGKSPGGDLTIQASLTVNDKLPMSGVLDGTNATIVGLGVNATAITSPKFNVTASLASISSEKNPSTDDLGVTTEVGTADLGSLTSDDGSASTTEVLETSSMAWTWITTDMSTVGDQSLETSTWAGNTAATATDVTFSATTTGTSVNTMSVSNGDLTDEGEISSMTNDSKETTSVSESRTDGDSTSDGWTGWTTMGSGYTGKK